MQRTHAERVKLLNNAAIATLALVGLFASSAAHAAWESPSLPTTAIAQAQTATTGLTATVTPYYNITSADVSAAVGQQLQEQGVVAKAEVMMNPGTPAVIYSADHSVKIAVHTLEVDPKTHRWQAQAYFIANGQTESVKPIAGTFGAMMDVPVVTRQFTKNDVIAESDLTIQSVPERLMRKDTISDPKQLIGMSPKNGISPNRPIHTNEISAPTVVKKGDVVEMLYETPYIHIKTTGIALEDGAKGQTIRVKNQKSEHAVSAQVVAAGRVQVAGDTTL